MCLRVKINQEPQIATEPIICYKCLTKDMLSPCFEQKYELGKMLISEFSIKKVGCHDEIEKGLHTFANESEAKNMARDFGWYDRISGYIGIHTPIIVKCEIPIGASYYKAVSMNVGISYEYASNQLIPLEIISK